MGVAATLARERVSWGRGGRVSRMVEVRGARRRRERDDDGDDARSRSARLLCSVQSSWTATASLQCTRTRSCSTCSRSTRPSLNLCSPRSSSSPRAPSSSAWEGSRCRSALPRTRASPSLCVLPPSPARRLALTLLPPPAPERSSVGNQPRPCFHLYLSRSTARCAMLPSSGKRASPKLTPPRLASRSQPSGTPRRSSSPSTSPRSPTAQEALRPPTVPPCRWRRRSSPNSTRSSSGGRPDPARARASVRPLPLGLREPGSLSHRTRPRNLIVPGAHSLCSQRQARTAWTWRPLVALALEPPPPCCSSPPCCALHFFSRSGRTRGDERNRKPEGMIARREKARRPLPLPPPTVVHKSNCARPTRRSCRARAAFGRPAARRHVQEPARPACTTTTHGPRALRRPAPCRTRSRRPARGGQRVRG